MPGVLGICLDLKPGEAHRVTEIQINPSDGDIFEHGEAFNRRFLPGRQLTTMCAASEAGHLDFESALFAAWDALCELYLPESATRALIAIDGRQLAAARTAWGQISSRSYEDQDDHLTFQLAMTAALRAAGWAD